MALNSDIIEDKDYDGYLIAMYLFDETALKIALQEVDDQSLAVGMIYIDNYEEALESVEEVRRSLLIALIDRKVNKYIAGLDGICKKIEKDKFLIIMRKKAIAFLQESRFDLLEDVKTVNIGNEMAVTISVVCQKCHRFGIGQGRRPGGGEDAAQYGVLRREKPAGGEKYPREGTGEGTCAEGNHFRERQGACHGAQECGY